LGKEQEGSFQRYAPEIEIYRFMTRHLFLLSFMLQRGIKVDFAWQSKSSFAPFVRKAHAQGVYALFADVHAGRASA
jgi:hypothetical protein